jgi:hypothetical protein
MLTEGICPHCGNECDRDSANVGVGIIYGPYGCPCGWSESEEYDHHAGNGGWQEDGSYTDTMGNLWPKDNIVIQMMRAAEERTAT